MITFCLSFYHYPILYIHKNVIVYLTENYFDFRSLNYGAQNAFHGPTNWILGHPVQNYPFAQQQVHQPLSHTKSSKYSQNSTNENNNRYKGIQGPSSYGVMSFGQRGGYNSGGTTGSGSSSQDPQKSPASRTSSKISYDSTGPHDERYYGKFKKVGTI